MSKILIQVTIWMNLENIVLSKKARHKRLYHSIDMKFSEQENP